MSAIGDPSPKDIRNFEEHFCSSPLEEKTLKLFNPIKINIARLKKAGISQTLNISDLEKLKDNVEKVHDYIQQSNTPLTPQQERNYQINHRKLQHLISPQSYEMEHYEPRDKQELEWETRKWGRLARTDFRNHIGAVRIDLVDQSQNPFHVSNFVSPEDSKLLERQVGVDLKRGHSILIKKKSSKQPPERFPPNASLKKSQKELETEFYDQLQTLGFSREKDVRAYTALMHSITQYFHRQSFQGCRDHGLLESLKEQFPVYCTAEGIRREGNPKEKIPTDALVMTSVQLLQDEQPPVIVDLDERTSSSFLVLSYSIDPSLLDQKELKKYRQFISEDETTPLIYIGVNTKMDWDTGKVTISGAEPLAIRNFKTGEMEMLRRPDIQFRSNDWSFPPER